MKIKIEEITVRDLVDGYEDKDEEGVVGYGSKLDIRPPYQREFIYNRDQQRAVVETVLKRFPLNLMYWVETCDGRYEILDGQQRTVSICRYHDCQFPVDIDGKPMQFNNLPDDRKEDFLNYKLLIGFCSEGTNSEKLGWFETINTAGEKLSNQELLNAIYHGPWVSAAKKYFSKTEGPAYRLGSDYIPSGKIPIRQDYLELALSWFAMEQDTTPQEYMSGHQHDGNADELRMHFEKVISWVKTRFPTYRKKEMKALDWGKLYHKYKDTPWNWTPKDLEARINELMQDEDVEKKPGIYEYLLSNESSKAEKLLNLRQFSDGQKRTAYERQKGVCIKPDGCGKNFEYDDMEGDHIKPWSQGGKTEPNNLQILCRECNRAKSAKY